jgi:hypothetical protein
MWTNIKFLISDFHRGKNIDFFGFGVLHTVQTPKTKKQH